MTELKAITVVYARWHWLPKWLWLRVRFLRREYTVRPEKLQHVLNRMTLFGVRRDENADET